MGISLQAAQQALSKSEVAAKDSEATVKSEALVKVVAAVSQAALSSSSMSAQASGAVRTTVSSGQEIAKKEEEAKEARAKELAFTLVNISKNKEILSYTSNQESSHKEIYISIDVETDGPTLFTGNLLNLSAVATDLDLKVLGFFEANIQPRADICPVEPDPATMEELWNTHPQQYARLKVHAVTPQQAMQEYMNWMAAIKKGHSLATMALPAGFDKSFVQGYASLYGGNRYTLDGVGSIDIESLIMMYKKGMTSYRAIDHKKDVPEFRQPQLVHSHEAIVDTIEQMVIGVNLLRWRQGLKPTFLEKNVIDELLGLSSALFGQLTCGH